jgi:hypothetical protein
MLYGAKILSAKPFFGERALPSNRTAVERNKRRSTKQYSKYAKSDKKSG